MGSVFSLMQEYAPVWRSRSGSAPVDLFGFRYDVGLDPIPVSVERMLAAFVLPAGGAALAGGLALGLGGRDALRRHLETGEERSLWDHL